MAPLILIVAALLISIVVLAQIVTSESPADIPTLEEVRQRVRNLELL